MYIGGCAMHKKEKSPKKGLRHLFFPGGRERTLIYYPKPVYKSRAGVQSLEIKFKFKFLHSSKTYTKIYK